MSFEEFQNGGHLGYENRVLSNWILHVTLMLTFNIDLRTGKKWQLFNFKITTVGLG